MQLFNIDSFSAHLWILLLSLCVLSQKETTQTVVNVKGYEDVTAVTVDIDPESEPVYILNFSKPQHGDFLHVVLNIDCSCTNRTGRTMEIEVARNTDNSFEKWEPAVISRTHTLGLCNDYSFVTWMMKFDEFDCYKHRHCFFAIRMGTSQTCKAELLVERGMRVEYGDNHIFDINPNTRMIRLFEYYPRQAPQSLTISQLSRHKQAAVSVYERWHLFYSWGYTLDRHMKTFRGQSTVSLDKNRYPWTAGDRLLLWFEAPAGQYGIEFLEDGDSNFLISSVMIISFLSCTFCCTFCLTFCCVYFVSKRTFHIISDSNEPPVSAPEPPAVATQDELVANTKLWRYSKQIAKKLKLKNKECIICLDKFEKDDIIRLLACGHSFHQACIDPWLTTRRKECPLCHQSLNEAQNFFRSVSGGTSDRGTSGSLSSLLSMSNWKASRSPRKSARQSQSHSRNSKSDSCSNPFQARMKNVTGKVQIEIFRTKGAKSGYKIQLVPTETDTSDMAPYQKICDGKINKNQPSNFSLDVSSCHSSTSSSLPSQLCHLINQEIAFEWSKRGSEKMLSLGYPTGIFKYPKWMQPTIMNMFNNNDFNDMIVWNLYDRSRNLIVLASFIRTYVLRGDCAVELMFMNYDKRVKLPIPCAEKENHIVKLEMISRLDCGFTHVTNGFHRYQQHALNTIITRYIDLYQSLQILTFFIMISKHYKSLIGSVLELSRF